MSFRFGANKATGLVIGAVAVVAATGVVLGLDLSGASGGPGATFGKTWTASVNDAYVGAWTTDTDLIIGTQDGGLTAYSLADGSRTWTWNLPHGDQICGMSPTTSSDGYGAVYYGDSVVGNCGSLQLVDTGDGTALWKQPATLTNNASDGEFPLTDHALDPSVSGDTATSAFGNGQFAVYSATGSGSAPQWSTNLNGTSPYDGCNNLDGAAAVGSSVFALENGCTSGSPDQLLRYATAGSSKVTSSYPLASGAGCYTPYLVAEANYALVYCDNELAAGGGASSLWALPSGGGSPVQLDTTGADLGIAMEGFGENGASSGTTTAQELNLAVYGTTLYLPIATASASSTNTNGEGVDAVSLTTGQQLWSKQTGQGSTLIAANAGGAVTITQVSSGNSELEDFAAAGGATTLAPIPEPTGTGTGTGTATSAAQPISGSGYYLLDGNCLISIATPTGQTQIGITRDPLA